MTLWQCEYRDIPVDEYLMSEKFLLSNGYKLDHVPRLNELIGPHEGRYINLMRHERKPTCLLDKSHLPYWEEDITSRKYGVIPARIDEVIVHLPGEEDRAMKLLELYNSGRGNRGPKYEVIFGYLLGYTCTCIEAFYIRRMYILEGNTKLANSNIFKSVEKFQQAKKDGIIPDYTDFVREVVHDTQTEIYGSR